LDFEAVVLPVVVSKSLSLFIEPELLVSGILSPSLKDNISTTEHLSNSIEWELGDKIEWSIDVESEFFIESLGLKLSGLIKIEYLPLLVLSSVVTPNSNGMAFLVFSPLNIKYLVVTPVDKLAVLILEYLPPSRVGAPDLHVVGFTRVSDVP
jgi:hypothetical protein